MPVAGTGDCSALFAAWATACGRAQVTVRDAARAITGSDEPHRVDPGEVAVLGGVHDLPGLLADIQTRRAAVRLVLPVPGDPRGLSGPGPFTDAALEAGEAVRLHGPDAYALVPSVTRHGSAAEGHAVLVTWRAFAAEPARVAPVGTRRAAERDLHEALRAATDALSRLDVARLSPQAAAGLAALRDSDQRAARLPRSHPAEGLSLWEQADRLTLILQAAASDDGAAIDRTATAERRALLRGLATATRQAKVAAVNAAIDQPD